MTRDSLCALLALWEHADRSAWSAATGEAAVERALAALPVRADVLRRAARRARALDRMGIATVPRWELPERLRVLSPPLALFVRGDAQLLHAPAIAIVGSRRATPRCEEWAQEQGRAAAASGYAVVSGGATGIDAAAHRGALLGRGRTVAYLGVCADRIYPARNRGLFRRILEGGGALVSEHPPGVRTFGPHHALRNRFIAAHGDCLVVVEAAEGSGTLGTADWARRLGRPIWLSPDAIGGERAGLALLAAQGLGRSLEPGENPWGSVGK